MLSAEAEFAHVLSGGRAVLAETVALGEDDEEFLGLPGLLTAEQTAALLARRDVYLRKRASAGFTAVPPEAAVDADATFEVVTALRREVNGLVAQVSARTGRPHAAVHGRLRAAVPGPPSAAAPLEVLRRRRDNLMAQL